ncbi:DgyrCDS13171 [Dimorphilus gyrociliatus]|uniref:DgyrCDS13171 n=1 Tax=Dimorphilus gyrociliatus TaxID=2664684 RepID=A0A7I8W9Y0_9ANNE|nr:DgyrCDS13171 [Dimorphilus gyrociliatus]
MENNTKSSAFTTGPSHSLKQTQQKILEARDKLEKLKIKGVQEAVRLPPYLNVGQAFPPIFCPVPPSMFYATAPSHHDSQGLGQSYIPYGQPKSQTNYHPVFNPIPAVVPIQIAPAAGHVPAYVPPVFPQAIIPEPSYAEKEKEEELPVLKLTSEDLLDNVKNVEEKTFHVNIGDKEGSHVAIPVTEYIEIADTLAYGVQQPLAVHGPTIVSKHMEFDVPSFLKPLTDQIRFKFKSVLEGYCLKEGVKENDKKIEDLGKSLWIGCCLSAFKDNVELADQKEQMLEYIKQFIF